MKAIVLKEYGIPAVLQEQEIDVPVITETQVLVEMYAASINPADSVLRSGAVKDILPVQLPYVLGADLAGVVIEVGSKVTHLKPGDHVMGIPTNNGGAYADYVAMEENALAIIQPGMSFYEAAALPTVGLTAWQSLFRYGKLQSGQRILIHAGAGGVGHIAVQLAKQAGAYVIATAREFNHEFVRQLGADEVIDYTTTDFTKAISSPVDIVLDMVMDRSATVLDAKIGETGRKSYSVLKDGGKLISLVAMAINEHPQIRGIKAQFVHAEPNHDDLVSILQNVHEQKLKVHLSGIFPFTSQGLSEAYLKCETNPKRGKVVIQRKQG
ncbi:NADP-dependent oxidoreductase [Clostridium beijerinckii]|uniref:NADP-dependent oxidoreductase n=1 Tax=Clostridium beijerinckii TaxID=1520 RepID=UPI0003D2D6F9|nr:NADP-dependent oxidoreductase [Clostridium beijerinckii]ALB45630.1 NADP-dependent oxidoreductase [Clostridium beijerinckii NRRL B-598]